MAVQVNGNYQDVDVHPNRVEQHNKLERFRQEIESLCAENEHLKLQLLQANRTIFQLQHRCESVEWQYSQLKHKYESVELQKSQLQRQCEQQQQQIDFLEINLENMEKLLNQLTDILDSNNSKVNFSKAKVDTKKCTLQQKNTVMKKLEEPQKKTRCSLNEALNVSKHVKIKVVDSKDAEMLENKLLVYDRNAVDESREQTCNLRGRTARRDKLDSIILGRFEVDSKLTECMQCHQVFNSLAEMEDSKCIFHPTNCSPTGSPGKYFWKCCKVEAAKSCGGCQIGRHIQATHY